MLPALRPFLLGMVVTPLAKRVAKPLLREVVKVSIALALDVRKAAADARTELQDIAAEVAAEYPSSQFDLVPTGPVSDNGSKTDRSRSS